MYGTRVVRWHEASDLGSSTVNRHGISSPKCLNRLSVRPHYHTPISAPVIISSLLSPIPPSYDLVLVHLQQSRVINLINNLLLQSVHYMMQKGGHSGARRLGTRPSSLARPRIGRHRSMFIHSTCTNTSNGCPHWDELPIMCAVRITAQRHLSRQHRYLICLQMGAYFITFE